MAFVIKVARGLAGKDLGRWYNTQSLSFSTFTADTSKGAVPSFSIHSEEFKAWQKDSDKDAALLMDGLANQDLISHSLDKLRARSDLEVGTRTIQNALKSSSDAALQAVTMTRFELWSYNAAVYLSKP